MNRVANERPQSGSAAQEESDVTPLIRLHRFATSIARAVDRHRAWLLGAFSALYFGVVVWIAAGKPLENDELFTLHIARLPRMTDVWGALTSGGEQLPPLFFVLTRASLGLGESPLTLRLPAILGFWVMSLSLYRLVSRRSRALMGFIALLFPLTTGAYYYAFEARPYGLVLGFSGIALVCWQAVGDGRSRGWLLSLMTLSLACAVSCHYYAVLVLIPLACGEAVRSLSRRRIDAMVWTGLVASLVPLVFFLPLIASARANAGAFWSPPHWGDIADFFYFLMMSTAIPLTAILLSSAIDSALDRESESAGDVAAIRAGTTSIGLRSDELATAVGFLLIPAVAVTMAMLVTGAYTHRYALPAVLGVGLLIPFALRAVVRGRDLLTLVLIVLLGFGFVRRAGMTAQDSVQRVTSRESAVRLLQAQPEAALPIVCSDQHAFIVLSEYAPTDIRARLVYLADPAISMRTLHHDSLERGTLNLLKPWFKLNVESYQSFMATNRPFLLYGDPQYFLNWLLPELLASGRPMELRGRTADALLLLVGPDAGLHAQRTEPGAERERPGD